MPIYAYRCTTCGHAQDVLRKISDPPLSVCPTCGAATFVKQVTAAGFQLKGSGWYATDFKSASKKEGKSSEGKGEEGKSEAKSDAKAETKAEAKSEAKAEAKSESKPEKKSPASTTN